MQASVSDWNNLLLYLLLIKLLSLKVKVCYILHSIQSYLFKQGGRKIKEMGEGKKKIRISRTNNQTAFADCLDHSIA